MKLLVSPLASWITSATLILTTFVATSSAAPIIDPTLFTTIDPSGGAHVDINATNAVTGLTDLNVIQNWGGWLRGTGTDIGAMDPEGQIIAFTNPTLPDLKFTTGGTSQAGTHAETRNGVGTSVPSGAGATDHDSIQLRSSTSTGGVFRTAMLIIDFGSYDVPNSTFNGAVNGVKSAAFTISDLGSTEALSVVFYNGLVALSTQTATGGADPDGGSNDSANLDVYFGYTAPSGQTIDRIEITRSTTSTGAPTSHFDDLGFTTIPEPTSLALSGSGAALIFARKRRLG